MADDSATATVSIEDFEKVKGQMQSWMAKATDYEKRFEGFDPEEYKTLKAELKRINTEKAGADPKKIEELVAIEKAELEKVYSGQLTEKETALEKASRELKELRVVNSVMTEASSFFNKDALPLIKREVLDQCDWEDGHIVIKDSEGKILRSEKNPRENMGPAEFLEKLAGQYPSLALATTKGGTREAGEKRTVIDSDLTVEKFMAMSASERAALPADIKGKFSQAFFRSGQA